MILVADSGSTKCDWLYFDKDNVYDKVTTMGFNPFFHNTELIISEILKCDELREVKDKIEHIYYFGAGCSSKERNSLVQAALSTVFPNAKNLVEHDLLGAAYASCGSSEGIACILGTGSNSCYYDGEKVHEEVPALGFILGDEGGGDTMGRKLLAKYLYKQLPENIHRLFRDELKLTKESIFESVYTKPNANVFMASLMREIQSFKDEPFLQEFVGDNVREFLETHVCCYTNHKDVTVNFVGSIAYYFEDVLKREASKLGITIGAIEKKPIFPIKDFFYEKHFGIIHEQK